MQNKTLQLFVTFVVLFSLRGLSQTTEKPSHPLLDKYYPQKQSDTSKKVITQTSPVSEPKPVTEPKPVAETKPVTEIKPVPDAKPLPPVTGTTGIDKTTGSTLPVSETQPIAGAKSVAAITDTTVISKPINVTVPLPVQKSVQAKPPAPPYLETRLGSSSPLYDTWEKNNNGAGSVTTRPK
jgi:zinc finger protein 185